MAGLVGCGRSELAEAIFGIRKPLAGRVRLHGEVLEVRSPADAIRAGIYLVPEDRRHCGLVAEMSVAENLTLPSLWSYALAGWIKRAAEVEGARSVCAELKVRTPSVLSRVANLSGGNQQKVVLGRWLSMNPKVMLFDEPTRGIDVGSKAEIHALIRSMADSGTAVLMISSDMEEILANSDRVAVMHEGRLTGILDRSQSTEEAIMQLAVA
jgi:ribose transport system ATP-binding protein